MNFKLFVQGASHLVCSEIVRNIRNITIYSVKYSTTWQNTIRYAKIKYLHGYKQCILYVLYYAIAKCRKALQTYKNSTDSGCATAVSIIQLFF